MLRVLLTSFLLCLACGADANERIDEVRNYIFGNSLIHHETASDETTVPHWLHHLAAAAGKRYGVDGQWGFPHDFIKNLPPIDQWKFKEAQGVWDKANGPFDAAPFDTIIMNPANFIQEKAPDEVFRGFGPKDKTPFSITVELFDWVDKHKPGLRYFLYEGWSTIGPFTKRFPPNAAGMTAFHEYNRGKYHDWYVKYLQQVTEARPALDLKLIPVASVMAKMLTQTPLSELKPHDLYSDMGPHGTNNVYFLAAVITYSMLYETKAPASFAPPASLHPLVRANYRQIADMACTETLGAAACEGTAQSR